MYSYARSLLLNRKLIDSQPEDRVFYLSKEIDNYVTSVYRQTMYTEYEKILYEKVANGEELTVEFLNSEYDKLLKSYYGDVAIIDSEYASEWTRLGHLFRWSFYPYKYATGLLIAYTVYNNLITGNLPIEEYIEFLSSGSKEYSLDLMRKLHINMKNLSILEKGFEVLNNDITELEKYID